MNPDTSRPTTLARRLGANYIPLATALLAFFLFSIAGRADGLPYTFTKVGPEYRLTLQPSTSLYFGFQQTADLLQEWNTIQLSLGGTGPIFGYTPAVSELRAFLRARGSGQ